MILFYNIFITFIFVQLSLGVDRSNFKTCDESSFCQRNRKSFESPNFSVDANTVRQEGDHLEFQINSHKINKRVNVVIFLLEDNIVRVQMFDDHVRFRIPEEDVMPSPLNSKITRETMELVYHLIEGEKVSVAIIHDLFQLKIYYENKLVATINDFGKLNLEDAAHLKADDNSTETKDYSETFKGHKDSRTRGPESISLDVTFHDKEFTYGIPEHADSFALKNTDSTDPYRLYNLDVFEYELNNPMALYGSVPVIFSTNAVNSTGMFWNNPSETWVDIKSTRNTDSGLFSNLFSGSESTDKSVNIHWMSESGIIDLFIMTGPNSADVSRQYAKITGTTPLPPLFSIGYHQCRWNYNSQDDIMSVDANFDKYNIPVDVLWLDIEHTNGKRYFTWDTNKFPDPAKMVDSLLAKKRRLVTVVDPHIKSDSGYSLYSEGKSAGHFLNDANMNEYSGWCWPGSSAYPDFADKEVRKWWSSQFLKYDPIRDNTMFSWNDMGEPSVFSGPEITMQKDIKHHNGFEHRDVHNLYGMYIHMATWEGQLLRSGNAKRPFVLTRAFFAGSQKTSAVWTGDNKADWSHLEASLPMLLSLSITGITFCGADVGGFFNNPPTELLVRWYQAGAYQPFFRAHAHIDTSRREPWLFDKNTLDLIREAIQERYAILPYWYTQFYLSEKSGQPIMAPLWYHFPSQDLLAVEKSYTIGKDILVSPVTAQGATTQNVDFPVNETWYQAKTYQPYSHVAKATINVDLATIPVFFRAGSIIPQKLRFRRSSTITLKDPFTMFVFVDGKTRLAEGQVFVDDGETIKDPKASLVHCKYELNVNQVKGVLSCHVDAQTTSHYAAESQIEDFVIVGMEKQPVKVEKIDKNGQKEDLTFTMESKNALKIRRPTVKLDGGWTISVTYQS